MNMPTLSLFESLPDEAIVWLFPLERKLNDEERESLLTALSEFIAGWQAHKNQLFAKLEILDDQIIAVAVDEQRVRASGCSIDEMTKSVNRIVSEEEIRVVRASEVLYVEAGEFRAVTRSDFQKLLDNSVVLPSTIVFDNTIKTARDVRQGAWKKKIVESWHAHAFSMRNGI